MTIIHFIQAGGTIDKDYHPNEDNHGYNFSIENSAWHDIWRRTQVPYDVGFSSVCRKDSLDMNLQDRKDIRRCVQHCDASRVIVLHGTDTIRETAEVISAYDGKTVVLTGAMRPAIHRETDADFNLGLAVAAVQLLDRGVYIALYGEVTPWNEYVAR